MEKRKNEIDMINGAAVSENHVIFRGGNANQFDAASF